VTHGSNRSKERQGLILRLQNVAWVQSLPGWALQDCHAALIDANLGLSYHSRRPSLEQVRMGLR
jgi:hypothetical protein